MAGPPGTTTTTKNKRYKPHMRLVTGGMTVHMLDRISKCSHMRVVGDFYIAFGYYSYMISISRMQ